MWSLTETELKDLYNVLEMIEDSSHIGNKLLLSIAHLSKMFI